MSWLGDMKEVKVFLKSMIGKSEKTFFFLKRERSLLIIILSLAWLIRVYGISFGLPYLTHPDEPSIANRALTIIQTGQVYTVSTSLGKPFSYYIFALAYLFYFIPAHFIGGVSSTLDWNLPEVRDNIPIQNPDLYLVGRFTTVIFGTLVVYIVYLLGKRLYGSKVGLIGAFFTAFSFLEIVNSKYIRPDLPMALFLLLSFLFFMSILEKGEGRYYKLSGFLAGLAIATKYNAFLIVVPFLLTHIFRSKNLREVFNKDIVWGGSLLVLGFALGSYPLVEELISKPHFLVSREGPLYEFFHYRSVHFGYQGDRNWFYFAQFLFEQGLGAIMFLLALGGIIYTLFRPGRKSLVIVSFIIAYYLFLSSFKVNFLRNLVAITPLLALTAAIFLAKAVEFLSSRSSFVQKKENLIIILLATISVAPSVIRGFHYDRYISDQDTRAKAARWIEREIPQDSRIIVEGNNTFIPRDRYSLRYINNMGKENISISAMQNGYWQYVVFNSFSYGGFIKGSNYYSKLFTDLILVKEYKGNPFNKYRISPSSPEIKIYRVPQNWVLLTPEKMDHLLFDRHSGILTDGDSLFSDIALSRGNYSVELRARAVLKGEEESKLILRLNEDYVWDFEVEGHEAKTYSVDDITLVDNIGRIELGFFGKGEVVIDQVTIKKDEEWRPFGESGAGRLRGWEVNGNAFRLEFDKSNRERYFITTNKKGFGGVGSLQTRSFTLLGDQLRLKAQGDLPAQGNRIALKIEGEEDELLLQNPISSDEWTTYLFDLSKYKGRKAYLKVDDYSLGKNRWISLADIRQTDLVGNVVGRMTPRLSQELGRSIRMPSHVKLSDEPVRIYEAEEMSMAVGSNVEDKGASEGKARFGKAAIDGSMFLIFGPYHKFSADRYRVHYILKVKDNSIKDKVVRIEVVSHGGRKKLALKDLRGIDFSASKGYQDFYLDFANPSDEKKLEFRVYFYDRVDLWVDLIVLEKI